MACAYLGPGIINYLTEISMPKMRGAMLSSFAFFFSLGGLCASIALKLIADVCGPISDSQSECLTDAELSSSSLPPSSDQHSIHSSPSSVSGLRSSFIFPNPQVRESGTRAKSRLQSAETPGKSAFLCKRGQHDKAKKSLRRLIGNVAEYDFDHEYSVLRFHVEESVALNQKLSSSSWAAIFKGNNLRRTVISCLPFTLQVSCLATGYQADIKEAYHITGFLRYRLDLRVLDVSSHPDEKDHASAHHKHIVFA